MGRVIRKEPTMEYASRHVPENNAKLWLKSDAINGGNEAEVGVRRLQERCLIWFCYAAKESNNLKSHCPLPFCILFSIQRPQ